METQIITIPPIELKWTDWTEWDKFKLDFRRKVGVNVPIKSGVYEAKYNDTEERLDIGRGSDLRARIKGALVKGTSPHSTGSRIRDKKAEVDFSKVVVRWAETDRPAAVEEELHIQYKRKFGKRPEFVKNT